MLGRLFILAILGAVFAAVHSDTAPIDCGIVTPAMCEDPGWYTQIAHCCPIPCNIVTAAMCAEPRWYAEIGRCCPKK